MFYSNAFQCILKREFLVGKYMFNLATLPQGPTIPCFELVFRKLDAKYQWTT
jgi:hypothetical protein